MTSGQAASYAERHARPRPPHALLAMAQGALLAVGFTACGSAATHDRVRSLHTTPVDAGGSGGETDAMIPVRGGLPMSAYEPPTKLRGLKGDGDKDLPSEADGYRTPDNDNDARSDRRQPGDEGEGYRDSDDLDSLRVGAPAGPALARTIAAVVRRYYAVAATGNGARACGLLSPGFARAVPTAYGEFGPAYLHGGRTCAAVASLQFRHDRSQLTAGIQVTAVHLERTDRAYALFGSKTTPASFIAVVREGGTWKVAAIMGRPEP
jgi:hypothetical protein